MKKTALILSIVLVLSPLCATTAEASRRSSRHHHDNLSAGEAIAALLITGLVVAAIGADSNDYVGSPWGVIDTEVTPKASEVYIDGGFAGHASKFDGWPGYLPLEPGRYRIEFRHPGYEPFRVQVRVLSGRRLVIKKRLHRLGEGPPVGSRQGPPPEARERGEDREDWRWEDGPQSDERGRGPGRPAPSRTETPEAQGPPPVAGQDGDRQAPAAPPTAETAAEMSELKLEIAPEDASVYLDGQFYINGKDLEGGARAILLAPGEYKLEVVRPGYKTQNFTVVLGAEPRTLKIQMERQ